MSERSESHAESHEPEQPGEPEAGPDKQSLDVNSYLEDLTDEIMTLDESLKQSTNASQETHNLMVEMMNNMVGMTTEMQEINTHLRRLTELWETQSLRQNPQDVTPPRRTVAFSSPKSVEPKANTKASPPKARSRSRSRTSH